MGDGGGVNALHYSVTASLKDICKKSVHEHLVYQHHTKHINLYSRQLLKAVKNYI